MYARLYDIEVQKIKLIIKTKAKLTKINNNKFLFFSFKPQTEGLISIQYPSKSIYSAFIQSETQWQ